MYNIIKKCLPIAVCVGMLTSCTSGIKIDTIDKSYSTDTISVKAEIPQLCGLKSKDLENSVNDEYQKTITELLNNFSKSAKQTGEKSVFELETTEHYNRDGFLSIVTEINYYAKKTHKNSCRITKNIDTGICCELSLCDLFSDDRYIDAINEYINEEVKSHQDKYTELWAKPKLSQNQRFYINGKYLVLFYPPYELSYYERGFVEIPIELEALRSYLKPEYRTLITE